MRHLPFLSGRFDVVTSLFTSFGYFGEAEDRLVLAEAARVLEPGGWHVLDFLNRERVLEHPNPVTSRLSAGYRVDESRRIEADRRVVKEVVIRPADGGEPLARYEERVTLYDRHELVNLLGGVGLEVTTGYGDYDGSPFEPASSPRLVVLSRKEAP
jgi:SAM-dependent methyltransferase